MIQQHNGCFDSCIWYEVACFCIWFPFSFLWRALDLSCSFVILMFDLLPLVFFIFLGRSTVFFSFPWLFILSFSFLYIFIKLKLQNKCAHKLRWKSAGLPPQMTERKTPANKKRSPIWTSNLDPTWNLLHRTGSEGLETEIQVQKYLSIKHAFQIVSRFPERYNVRNPVRK